MLTRRSAMRFFLSAVGAQIVGATFVFAKGDAVVTRADVNKLLDTADPENHCGERHDHSDNSFDDWKGSLEWSARDCGHNEGAAPVIRLAVANGLSYPGFMRDCPDTENAIPIVEKAMKDPATLDDYLRLIPQDKAVALKQALKDGKSPAEILVLAPEDVIGEAWRRVAMMKFAKALSTQGKIAPAVAIATASQWHNCHAFKCLLRHPGEIVVWLKG
jgi:hypothetical protein